MIKWLVAAPLAALLAMSASAANDEQHHAHPAPEKLGEVKFATACAVAVKPAFDRALALLHSFAYSLSEQAFRAVSLGDPGCAMAHWGMAMTHYHQLWEPPTDDLRTGKQQIALAEKIGGGTPRERQFIAALGEYYRDAATPALRAQRYASAMARVAATNSTDTEAQIFYALALIATASPTDKTHANQKRAADILEPIYRRQPQHPGLAHYLIHAYDSAELAPRGLAAARAYALIAPSAPHALHMPSHIFTRLGLWNDSIASNLAARAAAHAQGDLGEELHAMDYLTYAYLQRGRFAEAQRLVGEARSMTGLPASQFKIGYAATAMPVRLAIERHDWNGAASLEPLPGLPPQVVALVYWARALGHARATTSSSALNDIEKLRARLSELRNSGNAYWATQVDVMLKEAEAWSFAGDRRMDQAVASLRSAADVEDGIEKLPVTPGPIVPAREQLGELLLLLKQPQQALREFQAALLLSPGRHGAIAGAITAAEQIGDTRTANQLRAQLH